MKRMKILAAIVLGCLFVGVIALALRVTMTGSGSLGGVMPGWSILESCTPSMPGDSRGSVGSASFRAHAKTDSRFVADNTVTAETSNGSWLGRISEVAVDGLRADVSAAGALQFLNVDKTMPPAWTNDSTVPDPFVLYGDGTGEVGSSYGATVDPVDGGVLVTSYGTVDGVDRYRVIKYDRNGQYVTEFGSFGTGNGQFGTAVTVAVASNQTVYVGDGGNQRIQVFTTADGGLTYTYSSKFGTNGVGDGQFSGSSAIPIALDSNDNVFAGDRGGGRVQKFNSAGTFLAKVSMTGGPWFTSPYDINVSSTDEVYVSLVTTGSTQVDPPRIRVFSNSLVFSRDILADYVPSDPVTNLARGYLFFAIATDDSLWVAQVYENRLRHLTTLGAEIGFLYTSNPTSTTVNDSYNPTIGDGRLYVYSKGVPTSGVSLMGYTQPRLFGYGDSAPVLSAVIGQYMEACDLTLNGWTLDYQAAVDPEVVVQGWSGNVWANLKELFATYAVELVYDASTQTIIIRDIGSATTTFTNIEPATTRPVNLTGGRVVDVIYQQPRAGGGVVWDAATENQSVSIKTGETVTRVFSTDNHPAELAQPVPTDTLPIQPGQYYVVDNAGLPVPAATWLAAGGNITLTVGSSPGTISAFIQGPASNPSGFTGPYSFATGNEPDDTPALSIVGNGTFCTPTLFTRAGSQGQPFNSPFMDTVERIAARGHYPSLQDPNVVLNFIVPTADLPPVGQASGVIFPYEDSRYRILEVQRGNLKSTITAERWVTIEDIDTLWAGQTIGDFDTAWSGYSLGDIQVQPLRTA